MNKNQILKTLIRSKPSLYLLQYYTIRGNPITFINKKNPIGHRPWQVGIIDDQHPDKVVRKSRQLGLSEIGVAEFLWFLDYHNNTKGMFVFPRDRQVKDFVKTRVNPVLENNPYFKSIVDKNMDSIEVKRIRDSYMIFRAPGKGGALGEGADIDYLSLDEYDRMPDGLEYIFQESMKSSKYSMLRRWSTPTIPGRGIDAQFQKSDQRYFMHKCEACNHWQILNVEDNIVQVLDDGVDYISETIKPGTFKFVCAKCGKELDRTKGEWVAKYPSRTAIRGYHISQLNFVHISADDIKRREFRYTSKQLYYNYVIGEPYVNEGLIINENDVVGAIKHDGPITSRQGYDFVVVGIDWGYWNYAAMLGVKGEQIDLMNLWRFKDNPAKPLEPVYMIAASIKPYNPDLIIADDGYGADRNSALQQIFKGKAWSCRFRTYKGQSQVRDNWNEKQRLITVDKTLRVQNLIHTVKAQKIGFWKLDEEMLLLMKHLHNTRIMDEEDDDGNVYQVATRVGDDHYASALVFALVGVDKYLKPYQRKPPKNRIWFDFI